MKKLFIAGMVFFQSAVYAQSPEPLQLRIAVMKITANNCSPSLGTAVEELLSGMLFETKEFILLEKAQMDRIAQKAGFTDFDSSDNKQIAKLGKVLNVDKMVVGSISRIGNYRIDLRSIDVKTGEVDISVNYTAESESEIEKGVKELTEKIERHYLGYNKLNGNYDVTLEGGVIFPAGALSSVSTLGYGANLSVSFNKILFERMSLIGNAGAYSCTIKKDSVKELNFFPLTILGAWNYRFTKTFSIRIGAGAGVLISSMNYDADDKMVAGQFNFEKKNFADAVIAARVDMSMFIYDRWNLSLVPSYMLIPGGKIGHIFGLDLGVKTMF